MKQEKKNKQKETRPSIVFSCYDLRASLAPYNVTANTIKKTSLSKNAQKTPKNLHKTA